MHDLLYGKRKRTNQKRILVLHILLGKLSVMMALKVTGETV